MLIVLGFAFVAGALTVLAPCTLPIVPLVLGTAATGGPRRTTGIAAGFGLTFVATTVILASALSAAGATTAGLRVGSAIALGLAGLALVVGRVDEWARRLLAPVAAIGRRVAILGPSDGLVGGLVMGGAIGLVWAPCVGPIMAAVIATAAVHGPGPEAVLIAFAYVAGATVPIALIAGWGRRATRALAGAGRAARIRRGFGGAMLVTAMFITTGLDVPIENKIASALPAGWGGALLAIEQQPDIQKELDMLRTDPSRTDGAGATAADAGSLGSDRLPIPIASSLPAKVVLEDLGPAPEFIGIDAWINSDQLTIGALRGKVVLVEFWTFGCINCQHVQPYVTAWSDRYAAAGLVVVGVHTPELSFERDLGNVRAAVAQAGIRYAVAFDPAYATWNAYRNSYWPAFFFIDRSGQIRHSHFGEGDYDGSEQVLRELLSASR